jgi:hypothetical protein
MKIINKWTLGVALFIVFAVVILVALSSSSPVGQGRAWPFGAHPVRMWLLSNQEIAGLDFACFVLSNRTARPVRYLQDRKSREPSYLLLEHSPPDPVTRMVVITNHNQGRMIYMAPTELPPHSSVTFTVRYPSYVTNGVLSVNYWPSRTRLQSFLYSLSQRVFGRPTLPTNAYERIILNQPFGR